MLQFDGNIEVFKNSFVIKDKNQILKVEEWGSDTVRILCSPSHQFDKKNKYGIEELEKIELEML